METHYETTLKGSLAQLGRRDTQARGLLLVGLYKLTKALFFGALGFGALHMIHHNFGDWVTNMLDSQRFVDPEGHIVSWLMDKADLVQGHQLREFSLFTIGYALLCLVEGTGLMMRRVWAEYFTVFVTTLGLPYESYELLARFSWVKVGALLINIVVLLYILWVVKQKRQELACSE